MPAPSRLAGALLALAVATDAGAARPGSPDVLVVGVLADPVTLDPHRATDVVSAAVVANVCEPLVRFRADGSRTEAALATTWATLDSRTWTFTLREGVRFHDGVPFDADAVVANVESLRRERAFPGTAARVGPHVVSIRLDKPNAALLATLSQPFFSMQSPSAIGRLVPVGTGPFRLASAGGGSVRLEAQGDYWGGAPRLGRVVFRRFRGEEALVGALVGGEVDVSLAVGHESIGGLKRRPDVTLDSQTGLNIAFLSLNNERPPFSDRRVRQAIARALDRDTLVAVTLEGHGVPARNPIPPSLWGYGARTRELMLDRPAARRLLAEAGHPQGFEAELLVVDSRRPYMPAPLRLADRIREDLAQAGIRVRIRRVPTWREYVALGTRGAYDMMVLGWQADTTDPNDFLSVLLGSEAIGTTNRSRYRSTEMDALLKRGRMRSEPASRLATYAEAQELFQRDLPWVPLYHVSVFTAHRTVVKGLAIGPTGVLRYDKVWKTE